MNLSGGTTAAQWTVRGVKVKVQCDKETTWKENESNKK